MSEKLSHSELRLTEEQLYPALKDIFGFNAVSGIPCGELRQFIERSSNDSEALHMGATNEREAVGITSGMWLGGKETAIYMQNSGLFLSSNDIGSIMLACNIPTVIVASWRGSPGETATQHFTTGKATTALLEAFDIPFVVDPTTPELNELKTIVEDTDRLVCVLKTRDRFNQAYETRESMSDTRNTGLVVELNGRVELNREEALETILSQTDTQAIFSSTGLISRSVYENYDGPNHFYNAGGFGLTSTLALGFSAAQPLTKTVIIEGDGSVLANLGNLNLVGHYQPGNLLHIVLDNGAYSSCSGEPTFGSNKITEIAAQLGYKNSVSVSEADQIENTLIRLQEIPGPNMLRVIINTEGRRDFGRPTQMAQIARRFRNHFSS